MLWLPSRIWLGLIACLALGACASLTAKSDPPPMYDVRSAVVLSGPGIPAELLSATGSRINAAIAATTHEEALPRVVLTVRIVEVQKGLGYQADRNSAKVSINAASVESGEVVAVASFDVTTFARDPSLADQIMAEDIAARIRSTFSLSMPRGGA